MKIISDDIKATIASHFRYQKQFPFVALEGNCQLKSFNDYGQADVLVVTKDRHLIEVEVKVSISDLRKDRNKIKHRHFRDGDDSYPAKYFYFAVPRDIANQACLICDSLFPYAGVLGTDGQNWADVNYYRTAKALAGQKLTFKQILYMVRAQSATVCRLAEALAEERRKPNK